MIPIVVPEFRALIEDTLALLPQEIVISPISTEQVWPLTTLDLLVQSMKLVAEIARQGSLDPARPGVPLFGRRLYHLSSTKRVPTHVDNAVDRKMQALQVPLDSPVRYAYKDALVRWLDEMRQCRFGAVVVDYDGTVCSTSDRFRVPPGSVQSAFSRLLESGYLLGFASGRGRSLHRALREWLPRNWWDRVLLGLYSGAMELRLDESLPSAPPVSGWEDDLRELVDRLQSSMFAPFLKWDHRPSQVTVWPTAEGLIPLRSLAGQLMSICDEDKRLDLRVSSSAHAVDVVARSTRKSDLIDRIQREVGGGILVIGDQGDAGGNDAELLAATSTSLSVDRCSAALDRCWNVAPAGERGPTALVRYLSALGDGGSPSRFKWRY